MRAHSGVALGEFRVSVESVVDVAGIKLQIVSAHSMDHDTPAGHTRSSTKICPARLTNFRAARGHGEQGGEGGREGWGSVHAPARKRDGVLLLVVLSPRIAAAGHRPFVRVYAEVNPLCICTQDVSISIVPC